jgi:hypothetical protein
MPLWMIPGFAGVGGASRSGPPGRYGPHRSRPWLYFMLAPAAPGCFRYELPGLLRERRVPALA